MKKVISLLLVVTMIISMVPVAFAANSWTDDLFEDVSADNWFYETVKTAYELGLMSGYGDGSFNPKGDISFGETIVVAARIHAIYNGADEEFIQGTPWYQVYVDYAEENGIIEKTDYVWGETATRLEFAEILSRSLPKEALKAINTVENGAIPDVKNNAAVYMLYRAGILIGNDAKGSFLPEDSIARCEVAAIAARMLVEDLRESVTLKNETSSGVVIPGGSVVAPETKPEEEPEASPEDYIDENNALTAPFDVVYPDLFASGEVAYSGEQIAIKMAGKPTAKEQKALSDAGVASLELMMSIGANKWYKAYVDGDVTAVMEKVRELDFVLMAEYDFAYETDTIIECRPDELDEDVKGNNRFEEQWYLRSCGLKKGWDHIKNPHYRPGYDGAGEADNVSNEGGEGIVVAVIDTGVDYNHTDLVDNIWVNKGEIPDDGKDNDGNDYIDDYYGYNAVADKGSGMDDQGHGTHVAGIIAAANNNTGIVGIAYNAKIMPIKAGMASGYFNSTDRAEAIMYAVENGADVINMSFGGSASTTFVQEALAYAYTNCVLVAAAGNDGKPNEDTAKELGMPSYPGALGYVLGVMSVNQNGVESSFTNWDVKAFNSIEYEVYAPGESMLSTIPGNRYASWDGTSMATPVVSAAAALLRAEFRDSSIYPTKFIYGQICGTATQRAACYDPENHGYHNLPGILDIYSALTELPTPDVDVQDYTVFDTVGLMGNEKNNGDGVIDAGETVAIGFELRNKWGKSTNTVVSINAKDPQSGIADPYITIHDGGSANYGEVGTYSTQDAGKIVVDNEFVGWEKPIYITVSPDCPNDYLFNLHYLVTCENGLDGEDESTYSNDGTYTFNVRRGVILEGVIDEDTTLKAENFYIIPNSLYIPAGVTVTVEPGTQIQFWSDDETGAYADEAIVALTVEGTLRFEGTADKRIKLFPGERMSQFRVEITQKNSGRVLMWYTDVVNPYLTIQYAEGCGFTQNYRNTNIYYRYLSGTTVRDSYTQMKISIANAKYCSFELLGCESSNGYYRYVMTGTYDSCIFADCAIDFSSTPNINNCVFYGNNNYLGEKSGEIANVELKSVSKLSTINVVKNSDTGTVYIPVSGGIENSKALAEALGGYLVCVNTEEELAFLKSSVASANVTAYNCGIEIDTFNKKITWCDGTAVGDFIADAGIANGANATINPKNGSLNSSTSTLSIIEIPAQYPDEIIISETETFIDLNSSYQINAQVKPAGLEFSGLIYESANEEVATVSETGLVSPVRVGRTEIYVYSEDRYVYNTITVNVFTHNDIAVESIELGDDIRLKKGDNMELVPQFYPISTTKRGVLYSSSNDNVATVSASGIVTAVGSGTATITVTSTESDEIFDSITVEVYTPVTGIAVDSYLLTLPNTSGQTTEDFGVIVSPHDATDKRIVWESSSPDVVYIGEDDSLDLSDGIAKIRATTIDGNYSVEFVVGVSGDQTSAVVKDIKADKAESRFIALMDDGTMWAWGGAHSVPYKLQYENVHDFAYTFDNYQVDKMLIVDKNGILNCYKILTNSTEIYNGCIGGQAVAGVKKVITDLSSTQYFNNENNYWFLTEEGAVYAWGQNSKGQLATGNMSRYSTAVQTLITDAKDIAASENYLIVLLNDGTVYLYGGYSTEAKYVTSGVESMKVFGNSLSVFKEDTIEVYDVNYSSGPSRTYDKNVTFFASNYGSDLYISDGVMYGDANGNNKYGQIGVGVIGETKVLPVLNVKNPINAFMFKNNTFFASSDGGLYSCGLNDSYQLGILSTEESSAVPNKMAFGIIENENTPQIKSVNTFNVEGNDYLSNAQLVIQYDQPIDKESDFISIGMVDDDGSRVAVTREMDLSSLIISPLAGYNDGETYTLYIPTAAVESLFGVNNQEYTLTFTYVAPEAEEEPFSIGLDEFLAILECNDSVELFGLNNAKGELTWESSDAGIAYVENGKLVKLSYGEVTLTATDESGASDSITVYISETASMPPKRTGESIIHGVFSGDSIELYYDRAIFEGSAWDEITLKSSLRASVDFTAEISGNTVIITPDGKTHNEWFQLEFPKKAVKQSYGVESEEYVCDYFYYSDPNPRETQINTEVERLEYTTDHVTAVWEDIKFNPYFHGNAILNRLVDDDVNKWLRVKGASASGYTKVAIPGNYWGTTNEKLINAQIYDFEDYPSLVDLDPGAYLTEAPENVWPFVVNAGLIDSNGNEVDTIGNETVTFYVEFNRDMDITIPLDVRFGSYYPCADYEVDGEYVSARRWEGTTTLTTLIEAGYQFWSIDNARAADNHALTLCKDWGRFTFEIDTASALAMVLQGEATDEGVKLTWYQDDFATLAGYNVYRADKDELAYYQKLNSSIIPVGEEEWFDDTVEPGQVYYYLFTVVKTDLSESEPSGKKMVMSKDTMAPVMYHTPVYQAYEGSNVVISATVTDNVALQSVQLHYSIADGEWTSVEMSKLNDKYSAVISGNNVTLEGIKYYVSAYDGVSYSYRGSESEPYMIVVQENPGEQMLGDVNGDGRVTIYDALMLLRAANNKVILDDEQFARADLNGDKRLSAAEALVILKYANGEIGTLTME